MRRRLLVLSSAFALAACSAFGSSGGGGGDSTNPPPADAAAPPDAGGDSAAYPSGSMTTIAAEQDATIAVAVDATSIYWWSLAERRIKKVDKASPTSPKTLLERPGQTPSALAVDGSGLYWLESGPDDEGGSSNRLRHAQLDGSGIETLVTSTAALEFLALTGTYVATTQPGQLDYAGKPGAATYLGLGISQRALGSDGSAFYYPFLGGIARLVPGAAAQGVIDGLSDPRGFVTDATSLYALVGSGSSTTLLRIDRTATGQSADAAVTLATVGAGDVTLAVDNLGIVYANSGDGTIARVARSGGTPTPLTAEKVVGVNAVAADIEGVYWTTDSGAVTWLHR